MRGARQRLVISVRALVSASCILVVVVCERVPVGRKQNGLGLSSSFRHISLADELLPTRYDVSRVSLTSFLAASFFAAGINRKRSAERCHSLVKYSIINVRMSSPGLPYILLEGLRHSSPNATSSEPSARHWKKYEKGPNDNFVCWEYC